MVEGKSIHMKTKTKVFAVVIAVAFLAIAGSICYMAYIYQSSLDYAAVLTKNESNNNVGNALDTDNKKISESSNSEDSNQDTTPSHIKYQGTEPVNILFLGIDHLNDRDSTFSAYRTDSIYIISLLPTDKKISVLNIPRDTYVYIPCKGKKDKINHAYVWGGMKEAGIKSSIDTVNTFIKYAKIDYYFAIDMEPFVDIVDELGGIYMDVDVDMKTNGANLSKGYQLLDGRKAYDFIHWRYSAGGDIDRVGRQQKFIKAIVQKLRSENRILDAVKIVLKYSKYIQTDLSTQQMLALANLYYDIDQSNVTFYNIPGIGKYIDGISYWIADEKQTNEQLRTIFIGK